MNETPAKRMFHLMPQEEWDAMCAAHATWEDVKRDFAQPEWCEYPGALDGAMGCWSLTGRMVTGRDYCEDCDCSKDYVRP